MSRSIRILLSAEQDINDIYRWYEGSRDGLGEEFLISLDQSFDRIMKDPLGSAVQYRDVRRSLLERFPYCVFYRVLDAELLVLAVLPHRRNPMVARRRPTTG